MEPQFNAPLYNKVLSITNDILHIFFIYGKEPQRNLMANIF